MSAGNVVSDQAQMLNVVMGGVSSQITGRRRTVDEFS